MKIEDGKKNIICCKYQKKWQTSLILFKISTSRDIEDIVSTLQRTFL
jgi:hypothetical protein